MVCLNTPPPPPPHHHPNPTTPPPVRRQAIWTNADLLLIGPLGTNHYGDVLMGRMASQITSLTIVYSIVYSGADQGKTSKLRVTGPWTWNSPVTGEFPAQRVSKAVNVSISWRHSNQNTKLLIYANAKEYVNWKWRPFCLGLNVLMGECIFL